ncbi:MAG TPA: hypothetical protein VNQ76_02040 [Planctomicrobium sp.]|nr:hypothetical protein [Planctomicrobium sp.]
MIAIRSFQTAVLMGVLLCGLRVPGAEPAKEILRLRVAAERFGITPQREIKGGNYAALSGPVTTKVEGPLKVTVTLLEEGKKRVCVISLDWLRMPFNVTRLYRRILSHELGIPETNVIFFASHNHSVVPLGTGPGMDIDRGMPPIPPVDVPLTEEGQELLNRLLITVRQLPEQLEPVSVWWAVGHEDRITYNRKGRRADGETFLMREEDRLLQGVDFKGDIDSQAPVVVFKNQAGEPVAAWVQFTGHPVTSFHPENPVVHGDYPQIACDYLSRHLGNGKEIPVGFFQGCAGDINSKEMFRGGVKRAIEFGEMLGQSYVDALPDLKISSRDGLDFDEVTVELPLAELPEEQVLERELAEIDDFISRARSGDENTLSCVGLNFPRDLSPAYRAGLVERIRYWTEWALEMRKKGIQNESPQVMPVELWVLRVGDVGIAAMPCEPFQGIGREMRAASPLPLMIPCGYANYTIGYIPDSSNVGDREYMSSSHRYTASPDKSIRPRPPFARPGGSVFAQEAVRTLEEMVGGAQ